MNNLKNTIELTDQRAQYDECAKKFLSDKTILAHILKGTIEEFRDMEPEDIAKLLESGVYTSCVDVEAGLTNQSWNERIVGVNTENAEPGEGRITFDVLFYTALPDKQEKALTDVEAQRKETPGYPLVNRSIFYICRMVSSQKGRDFSNSNYGDMVKAYSIWICFNMPENRMNRLHMVNEPILGNHKWKGDDQLLNIVLVGLSKDLTEEALTKTKNESELHYLLGTAFSDKLQKEDKYRLLDDMIDFSENENLRKGLDEMCDLSYGFEEKGYERGLEAGIKQGLERGIEQGLEQADKKHYAEKLCNIKNLLRKGILSEEDIKECLNASDEDIAKAKELL